MVEIFKYSVKSGDSLSKIALSNKLSLAELIDANPQFINARRDIDLIQINEVINVPKYPTTKYEKNNVAQQRLVALEAMKRKISVSDFIQKVPEVENKNIKSVKSLLEKTNIDSLLDARKSPQTAPADTAKTYTENHQNKENPNNTFTNQPYISNSEPEYIELPTSVRTIFEQWKNIYAFSVFPRVFINYSNFVHYNKTHAQDIKRLNNLEKIPEKYLLNGVKQNLTDKLNNSCEPLVRHSYGPKTTNLYRGFYAFNAPTGVFVAGQYAAMASRNLQNIINGENILENSLYLVSNASQALNGWGIAQRSLHEVVNRWYSPVVNYLSNKNSLFQRLKIDEITSAVRLPIGRFANNFFLNEWFSGTSLNSVFGVFRTLGEQSEMTRKISESTQKNDTRSAEITTALRNNYVIAGGALHTINQTTPCQWNGSVYAWGSWLINRFTNMVLKAQKSSYFGLNTQIKDGAPQHVLNSKLDNLDLRMREVVADFDYVSNNYGAYLVRNFYGSSVKPIENSFKDRKYDTKAVETLTKVENTQNNIRTILNTLLYSAGAALGAKYFKNYRFITFHWIKKLGSRIATENFANKIESLFYLKLYNKTDKINDWAPLVTSKLPSNWAKYIGAYTGFELAHSAHHLGSAATMSSFKSRADVSSEHYDSNLDPRMLGRTGFIDDFIANEIARKIHANSINQNLNPLLNKNTVNLDIVETQKVPKSDLLKWPFALFINKIVELPEAGTNETKKVKETASMLFTLLNGKVDYTQTK